eukprot:CAMPEP_0181374090 /NCGR_PEP_ID=MMETSP1106-20121128/15795_2 /TAXON_ID=81844 /ORGANISM="Mantoniella antarctica, Strain SL-175" /LENGTH=71 /DNA_ID=CAMNT_0023491969 /DNA_START=399 /DNA_END=614 /DNA_ORIENTATION=-
MLLDNSHQAIRVLPRGRVAEGYAHHARGHPGVVHVHSVAAHLAEVVQGARATGGAPRGGVAAAGVAAAPRA